MPGETKATHGNLRVAGVSDEIRTNNSPDTNLEVYRYAILLVGTTSITKPCFLLRVTYLEHEGIASLRKVGDSLTGYVA